MSPQSDFPGADVVIPSVGMVRVAQAALVPRQYYILTQAEIAGPFTPPPTEGDICQCLPIGGVWRFTSGQWVLFSAPPVVGVPLPAVLTQLQSVLVLSLVATDPATLFGYGTWALVSTGKLKVGNVNTDVWMWKRVG